MLFLTAKPVSGDTITVGGKRYENVLVTESPSGKFYYIKLPAEGRVINVSRDEVKAGSVSRLARDSKEYFALRDKYTTARKGGSQANTSTKSPGYSSSRKNPPEQSGLKTELSINGIEALSGHGGVPILTNDPSKYKNRRKAKPVFVTNRGIMVFTNDPEKYRDDRRYVEIALNYERIAVPQKYRVAAAAGTASDLAEIISYYARHYRLDENLVYAVIRCESNFNPNAVSHAGARGLMQLMLGTATF